MSGGLIIRLPKGQKFVHLERSEGSISEAIFVTRKMKASEKAETYNVCRATGRIVIIKESR